MDYSIMIKRIRNHLHLSQQAMADKLGVSFVTVNRWENGNQKPSSMAQKILQQLCNDNNIRISEETDASNTHEGF